MKIILLLKLFILIISFNLYSQPEKKFKVKKSNDFIEEYYVQKGNKKIKDGSYIKYKHGMLSITHYGIAILESGFFKNNIQDSIWEYYYNEYPLNSLKEKGKYIMGLKEGEWLSFYLKGAENDHSVSYHKKNNRKLDTVLLELDHNYEKIRSHGMYIKDKKEGLWRYYNEGELYLEFNHSINKPDYDLFNLYQNINPNTITKSHFIGDTTFLLDYLNKTTSPQPYRHKKGVVIIEFTIDEFGSAKDFTIKENSSNKSFGKYVLNKVKNIPHDWIPSFSNGIAIESTFSIKTSLKITNERNSNTATYADKTYKISISLDE